MKILNSMPSPSMKQSTQRMKQNQGEFEALLNTPTAQLSGDEYYQLHRDDLQHSELTFKKGKEDTGHFDITTTSVPQSKSPDATSEARHAFSSSQAMKVQSSLPQSIPQSMSLENDLVIHSLQSPLSIQIIMKEASPREPINMKAAESIHECVKKPVLMNHPRHQLFIEGNSAELAMNLEEFNPKEQEELIHLIKSHLKQQGIHLNLLKINGVTR